MSKIYMIGDTHLGLGYPNSHSKWSNIAKDYFEKFLIPLLKENIKEGDIIIHLGDLFDNRSTIPIDTLNYAMDIIEKLSSIAPFHILLGNHDLWNKSNRDINSVKMFKYIPNVFLYEETSSFKFNSLNLCMMPFIEHKDEQIEQIKKFNNCDYLFCHSDLNGAKMHLTSIANRNNDKINVEEFSNFKHVYSGHIHLVQKSKNFTFVGSTYEMDRNDYTNQKGIFVLDTNTGIDNFIPNNISPRFNKIQIINESDIDKMNDINENDFNDVSISNSLLANRKFRRKVEEYLKTSSFQKVEFLDDLKVTESTNDVKNEDILNTSLEYKDIVRTYIENSNYENDGFKKGLLFHLDDLIKMYENTN